jgi:hypothetical protein
MSESLNNRTGQAVLGALNATTGVLRARVGRVVAEFVNTGSFVGTVAIERRSPQNVNEWNVVTINGAPAVFTTSFLEAFDSLIDGAEWRLRVTSYTSGQGVGGIEQ